MPSRPTAAREGGNLVAQVHQLSGRIFARVLKAHGVDDLNPAQGRIIYELWQSASRPTDSAGRARAGPI